MPLIFDLSDVFAIKATTLSADDMLRFTYSINRTTKSANNTTQFPFRFKTGKMFTKANLATNCVYVFRQVAGANVIAELWKKVGQAATGTEAWVKMLARIRNICAIVSQNGDIDDLLKPFAVHGSCMYAESLLRFAFATKITSPSPEHAKSAFRTLVDIWRTLSEAPSDVWDVPRKKLLAAVIVHACAQYVQLVMAASEVADIQWLYNVEPENVFVVAARDSWRVATDKERMDPKLIALRDVYVGGVRAMLPMAEAVRTGVPPIYDGKTISLPPPNTDITACIGTTFVLND